YSSFAQIGFHIADFVFAKMKERSSQHRARATNGQRFVKVFGLSRAARRNHRNAHSGTDRARQLKVVSVARAIAIHAGQKNFTRSEFLRAGCPFNRVEMNVSPATMREDFPALRWIGRVSASCID